MKCYPDCDHCRARRNEERLERIEQKLDVILHGDDAAVTALLAQMRANREALETAVADAGPAT